MGFGRSFSLRRRRQQAEPPRTGSAASFTTPDALLQGHVHPPRRETDPRPVPGHGASQSYSLVRPKTSHGLGRGGWDEPSVNPLRAHHPDHFQQQRLHTDEMPPTVPPKEASSFQTNIPIGIALGSPQLGTTQAPGRAPRNIKPSPWETASAAEHGEAKEASFALETQDTLKRRPSKWGKIGGLFSQRKNSTDSNSNESPQATTTSAETEMGDRTRDRSDSASSSLQTSQAMQSTPLRPKPTVVGRKRSIRKRHGYKRSSIPPIPEGTILPQEQPKSVVPIPAPTLSVDIPTTKMDRYSVMFAGVLQANQEDSLLARRQATLEKRRSRSSVLPERRSSRRYSPPSAVSHTAARTRPHSKRASINRSARSRSRDVATKSRVPSPTPEELPQLCIASSPSSEDEVTSPGTPPRPILEERAFSAPDVVPAPLRLRPKFSLQESEDDSAIVVIDDAPTEEPLPHHLPGEATIRKNRMSLTPNRLEFGGKEFSNLTEPRSLGATTQVTGGLPLQPERTPGSTSISHSLDSHANQHSEEILVARQTSMRRRQLLLPIVRKNERMRGESHERLVVDQLMLKPQLIDLHKGHPRKSQQIQLDCA
ncbi:MAG: hypothetical protein M1824_003554 [Vezdaea acicularis]|nr:MAG: hypothetical protein M1824_003554 [Vezdaea acicularis]